MASGITHSSGNGVHETLAQPSQPSFGDISMPIAVIGLACRFPGDATSPEKFWEFIVQGRNALSEFPKDRFNIDSYYHPAAERAGSINIRGGYFLKDDIACFDAPFFSITPNEAKAIDPQQRALLELAYESLENAGIRMEDFVGSKTSCYVGNFTRDYGELFDRDIDYRPKYAATGCGGAMASNRVSWFFNLKGPSLTLDSACSSSLVGVHLACQSLRSGESKMALVGGVNLILNPDPMASLTSLNFLSPDAKCQAFDHKANGYARGEGFAVIALKPLDAAIRDQDVIRAVIRGSAFNQDGHTPGITLPSTQAQVELIRTAYHSAGLDLADTAYFEAHGTGTAAGDPLEAGALGQTFAKTRVDRDPLVVGSVKTNIGHLGGAAGLAGLIKGIYILERGVIPPHLWFEKANPKIPMEEWRIKIPTVLTPWPTTGLRRVSINSFGYGGSNAHVILDDAYHYLRSHNLEANHNTIPEGIHVSNGIVNGDAHTNGHGNESPPTQNGNASVSFAMPKLLVWSAHEQAVIGRLGQSYTQHLKEHYEGFNNNFLDRLAFTLACRRSVMAWKSFCVASSADGLREALERGFGKAQRSSAAPSLGFVFTGQGAQWNAMGRELLPYEHFRASLQDADKYMRSLGCPWSLLDELNLDEKSSSVNRTAYSQPMCTALQVALVDLLRNWNVKPTAVVGNSSGEIAAAYCMGAISREDAWKIAYHRGRLAEDIKRFVPNLDGGMLAAGLKEEQVLKYLDQVTDGRIVLACINSPSGVTISGDRSGIDQLHNLLVADGVFSRKLQVSNAYHSHHMKIIAQAYLECLTGTNPDTASVSKMKMFSSVTGREITSENLGPQYWVENLTSPVRFSEAAARLLDYSPNMKKRRREQKPFVDILVEIGPHATLKGPLKQILEASQGATTTTSYLSLLQRGTDAAFSTLTAIGGIYVKGYDVDIAKVNTVEVERPKEPTPLVDLPSYPWTRSTRYWHESTLSQNLRFRKQPRLDLLGAPVLDYNPMEPKWRQFIRKSENPWVQDHRVQSIMLYPDAGMIIMAIEALKQIADHDKVLKGFELRDIKIGKPIVVPQHDDGIETSIQMRPWKLGSRANTAVWQEFSIFSKVQGQDWLQNCSGLILADYEHNLTPNEILEEDAKAKELRSHYAATKALCPVLETPRHIYETLETIGLQYGPTFQKITSLSSGDYKSAGSMSVPDTKAVMPQKFEYPYTIHPATLDTAFQIALRAITGMKEHLQVPKLPTLVEKMYISANVTTEPGRELHGYALGEDLSVRESSATIFLWDGAAAQPDICIEGLHVVTQSFMTDDNSSSDLTSKIRKLCFEMRWKPDIDLMTLEETNQLLTRDPREPNPKFIGDLELAAFIYIRRIVQTFTQEDASKFATHHRLMYEWAKHKYDLAVEGKIPHQDGIVDWMNLGPTFEIQHLQQMASKCVDIRLLSRLGENFEKIYKGKLEPLQVMFENDLLYEFYRDAADLSEMSNTIATYMDYAAHKRPDLKILEIGAGTGSSTIPILEVLGGHQGCPARFSSYTFTDISAGFFDKAGEILKDWEPYLTYHKLDIEQDPTNQGFEAESYDIVIANNVLHATHSIQQTLANVKRLLKPSGKLVLGEVTQNLLRATMLFGWLPGWWNGENDGRKGGPTLTSSEWNDALKKQGFSGVDQCLNSRPAAKDNCCSVLISTASQPAGDKFTGDTLIVTSSASIEGQSLSNALADKLHSLGSGTSIVSLEDVPSLDLKNKHCIVIAEVFESILVDVSQARFEAVRYLTLNSAGVLWVTRGGALESPDPKKNIMVGLSRTIRAEHAGVKLATLDLELAEGPAPHEITDIITRAFVSICDTSMDKTSDYEYAVQGGLIHTARFFPQKEMNEMLADQENLSQPVMQPFGQLGRPLKLEIGAPGMLDTLRFVDDYEALEPLGDDELDVKVMASGLNFLDIMVSMGQVNETAGLLGAECSGIVHRVGRNVTTFEPGDRAVTFRPGCHRSFVRCPAVLCQPLPEHISFEEGASLLVIYGTVYASLVDAARMRKGESILIHAAAGGVGQAAIIMSQWIGAEIFATVGSEEKKRLIMSEYGILEDHIFDSRNLSFAKGIKRMTNGRGVDVVLNSLAGEALRDTWHCVAPSGRFIEIGKKDIISNTGLDMAPFINGLTFAAVNLIATHKLDSQAQAQLISNVMDLVRKGIVKPVTPLNIYRYSEIEDAFRLMQTGKHIGKIILKASDDDIVPVLPSKRHQSIFRQDSSYILAGGLGGLGRSVARWMVDRGARNLIFLSRSGASKPEAAKLVKELSDDGANVHAFACDVSDESQLKEVLRKCAESLPPVRGAIQGAMVLQDSTIEKMMAEDWTAAIRPKVKGSWNLHNQLPIDMDFFLLLSSMAGIVGNRGQGNYNGGNTYQDALAFYRTSRGLSASSVDLGMILGVGFVAETDASTQNTARAVAVTDNLKNWGFIGIREQEFLNILDGAITSRDRFDGRVPCQIITGLGTGGLMQQSGAVDDPWWFKDAKFSVLAKLDTKTGSSDAEASGAQLARQLSEVTSVDAGAAVIAQAVTTRLAKSMAMAIEDLDPSKPVNSYGVDSLVAVELRNWILREIKADLSISDILSNIPLTALASKIASKSSLIPILEVE